ncbi:diphosphomevalonate decarboxylase [Alloscardovia macacae]|uniref:diphosphomevalonate decarboxylase n=1 Tax=Alloscardovia macacae TaxID=1160091 RepID=A0A1Y2SUJ9_9BIFI|nr:diphosphomevalonate decarboxylase [Alloscardovia macacae]OTA26799.1 diphosphomevalonate decarboxylase [Alloscardovia macacae]OTA29205.1 diphosphomevalonate decarboxylase [Alloscardovia macacae]
MAGRVAARAHTNIALIKYWGKRDEALYLPTSTSLSLTLSSLYTDTRVSFDDDAFEDVLLLDGQIQDAASTAKVTRVVNLFRERYGVGSAAPRVRVESHNHVPTAAGLASSSSGFAALATALRALFEERYPDAPRMSDTELSTFARRGSGSATRSIFGGFVEWAYGTGSEDSVAVPVDDAQWDVAMVLVALSTQKKKISSTYGMKHTADTSAFYPLWREVSERDLDDVRAGIRERDIDRVGAAMEANCMKFHATMFAANPPFTYLTSRSLAVIEYIQELRAHEGLSVYYTMDAGPNVKVLCRRSEQQRVHELLEERFPDVTLFDAVAGPAPRTLTEKEWEELYG